MRFRTGKKINSDRIGNDKKMADRTDAKSAVQTELRIAPYIQTELRLILISIVAGAMIRPQRS